MAQNEHFEKNAMKCPKTDKNITNYLFWIIVMKEALLRVKNKFRDQNENLTFFARF